ncbi:MAG: metalloregulator ArsR/SmtB family transcription factor [Pseudomonadota bacterium]
MDTIFKALADPARREILDRLRDKDGQSLSELEAGFDMTRFGVMKHLAVLEDAGLVVPRKVGRFKYHYLNAVPLQEAIDRWIEPLIAKPLAQGISALKAHLEKENDVFDSEMKPDFVHQTSIRCTQDALWDALTKADQLAAYHFMCNTATGDAEVGQPTDMIRADGSLMLRQTTTRLEPKTRIEQTFEPHWTGNDAHSRIVFLIQPEGEHCLLTCEHYEIPEGQDGVKEGWARHIASLKSWLETGQPIKVEG